MDNKSLKRKRALILIIGTIIFCVGLYILVRPMLSMLNEPEKIKEYVESAGVPGIILLSLLNMLQVIVAFIPGGPFSFVAGYMWGPWIGTLFTISSTSFMSVIIFILVRKYGQRFVDLFVDEKDQKRFNKLLKSEKARVLLFAIYVVPSSPKDVLAYLAGLTNISLLDWIVINLIGRFPGSFFSALGGAGVESGNYVMLIAISIGAVIIYLIGTWLYNKYIRKNAESDEEE